MLFCPTVRAGIRQRSIITNGWLGDTNEREFTRTEDQPLSGSAAAEFRKERALGGGELFGEESPADEPTDPVALEQALFRERDRGGACVIGAVFNSVSGGGNVTSTGGCERTSLKYWTRMFARRETGDRLINRAACMSLYAASSAEWSCGSFGVLSGAE